MRKLTRRQLGREPWMRNPLGHDGQAKRRVSLQRMYCEGWTVAELAAALDMAPGYVQSLCRDLVVRR